MTLLTRARAVYTAALLTTTVIAAASLAFSAHESAAPAKGSLEEIVQRYADGEHAAVVEKVDRFLSVNGAPLEKVSALFMKAESLSRLGRTDAAADAYRDALAKMEAATNNITRREYAGGYLRYGQILREQGHLDAALNAVETGLRLVPQYVAGQIFRGQLLAESGQEDRALAHYRTQLASSLPVAEERAVLGIKADRLANHTSIQPPDLGSAPLHAGLSIGILPVNDVPSNVDLGDVCVILESSWRVRCEVLPPVTLSEESILDEARGQYIADTMITMLERRMPRRARRQSHLLAITGRDIYGPDTSFVFSWQQINEEHGVGVLSTSRFTDIQEYYEPEIIATRRVALQALSTTGSMFRFTRPTDPECPMAYPDSLGEFQQKRLRLCPSEEQQRDALLRRRGGPSEPFGQARADLVAQIYRRYFVE